MRDTALMLLALLLPLQTNLHFIPDDIPSVSAECAILCAADGEVLFERDADRIMPIASTTKLMTALVAAECCDAAENVRITREMCGLEGSSMYLESGEILSVHELLLGLLLVSGNDAAEALAIHCAGSEEAFCRLMNDKAEALGMENTHFINPHGLNDPLHYSTARDMALLMKAVMEDPMLAEINGLRSAVVGDRLLMNHNKLLGQLPGCIGGKTGYTSAAGRCLVSSAQRGGTSFICVTLADPDDWNDHCALYEWAFSHFKEYVIADELSVYSVPLLAGTLKQALVVPAYEHRMLLPVGSDPKLRIELPPYVFAPVRAGSPAGRLIVVLENKNILEIPLVYAQDYPLF